MDKTFHGLTKRQLRTLLLWTTKRTTFNFNGNSYDQIDGVAMGSPIASAFADIFMNLIIEKTTEFSIQRLLFYRYVDDCFAVFPNRVSASKFHYDLNTIHRDVKFTYKLEQNKQLSFLDVGLNNSTGSIGLYYQFIENQHIQDYTTNRKVLLRQNIKQTSFEICCIGPTDFAATADF